MSQSRSLAAFLVTLLLAGACQAQTTMKWAGKPGEKLKYTYAQVTEVKHAIQGQPASNKSELTLDFDWTIKSTDKDGTMDVTLVADRVKMRITSAGRILEYDSRDKEGSLTPEMTAYRKVYDAVLKQPFTLKVTAQGEVVDVKIPDAVIGVVGDTPFAASADSGSFLSPKGVKVTFAQIIPVLPKTPVAVGSTWKSELIIPATGPLAMTLKYDFKVNAIAANLSKFENTIATNVASQGEGQIQIKMNKQSGGSSFAFDPAGGHLVETNVNQYVDMTFVVSGNETPQTLAITTSFKLIK